MTGRLRMEFEEILQRAKNGDEQAKEEIFRMYQPLIKSRARLNGKFDEDLYQELSVVLLECIEKF